MPHPVVLSRRLHNIARIARQHGFDAEILSDCVAVTIPTSLVVDGKSYDSPDELYFVDSYDYLKFEVLGY